MHATNSSLWKSADGDVSEGGQLGYGGGGENWGRAHVPLGTIATWLLLIERLSNALVRGGAVHYFQH